MIVFAIIASKENIAVNDICNYGHENFASVTMCLTLSHSQEVFCDINDYKCSLCNHVLVYCQGQNKNKTHKTLYGFDNEQELYDFFV